MAALVLTPPDLPPTEHGGARLDIFPGSATPTVFAAATPFWVGYGFTAEPEGRGETLRTVATGTTFELVVDGEPVPVLAGSRAAGGQVVSRQYVAVFGDGLEPGWHRFQGRWYDAGALALTSDIRIEFVEP